MKNLTFKSLAKAHTARINESYPYTKTWTEMDWGCSLAGEVGELCNFIKKRKRVLDAYNAEDISEGQAQKRLKKLLIEAKKEIGDVQSYLSILAVVMGVDLGEATREKFNEVSKRVGSKIKI